MWHKVKEESVKSRDTIAITVRVSLLFLVVIAALFALVGVAEAQGTPAQVIVFTDKKVYKDFYIQHGRLSGNIPAVTAPDETDNFVVYAYAIVLDDDGNIMKGLSGITGVLNDTERLDHYNKGVATYHHNATSNPNFFYANLIFNDTGADGDGIQGDGIYTAFADLPDSNATTAADILDDHIRMNISATYGSLTSYTEALYSAQACHNGEDELHSTHTSTDVAPGSNGPSPCTMCHRGYEHFYENKSSDQSGNPTFPRSKLDVHFQKIPAYTVQGGKEALTIIWNLSNTSGTGWGGKTANWEVNMPGSSYCYICHYATAGGGPLDYGNADRSDLTDRPSCSVASKTLNAVTGTVTCHAVTNISGVPVIGWSQPAAGGLNNSLNNTWQAKSHNHTNPANKANASCALCHGSIHQFKLPNSSATGAAYLNINNQCILCHNTTGGLNITANGGQNSALHDGKTDCKQCHKNATGTLDSHLVPTGVLGGVNCTSCHNISGSATGSIVNFTSVNKSMHGNLNKNASSIGGNATNKPCWACHGTKNGTYANQSDQPLSSHNETVYQNPRKCEDCHDDTLPLYNAKGVTDHIPSSLSPNTDVNTSSYNNAYCSYCHNNSNRTSFDPDGLGLAGGSPINASVSHYGANDTAGKLMSPTNNSTDCVYCHRNSSNMLTWGILSTSLANLSNKNGTAGTGTNHNSYTSSGQCASCHGGYTVTAGFTFHNAALGAGAVGGVNCTSCHNISGSAKNVNFTSVNKSMHGNLNKNAFSTGGNATNKPCWACHGTINATSGLANESDQPLSSHNETFYNNPRDCQDCHITGQVKFNAKNVTDHIQSGYTSSTDVNTSSYNNTYCSYCHNNSIGSSSDPDGLGITSAMNASASHYGANRTANMLMTAANDSTDCAYCHRNNSNMLAWGILNGSTANITRKNGTAGTGINHTPYTASIVCKDCHGAYNIATSTFHNASISNGSDGGPNCIGCHYTGSPYNEINITAFNQSTHFGMNSVNSSANGACWACHDTVGNVTSGHGDKQKTPKSCEDCHLISGTYYTQAQAWGGLRVDEHYYSGTRIKAGNSSSNLTSCINCHENISEMILYNNDTDTGSFTGDGIRLNGGNLSSYHYGKNRTDLRSWNGSNTANCTYCHNNSNTLFNITMTNASVNTSLRNHSTAGSSPTCYNSSCHSGGWLHNSTLTRPLLPLPNTTYCQTCHSEKNEHNGTQQCSKCHINTTSSDTIHPIKYIQATGQYNTSNTTAANCTNCHQNTGVTGFNAPIIPSTLKHSSNASNGSIWNSTITPYWTTEETSCYYCHNDTKHNSTALGRITVLLNTSNVRNGSLTTTGWCADCHYNATVNTNYKGNLWNPVPPVITVNNTGKARWDNHSGYFGSGYNDSVCEGCHSQNITAAGTSLNYSHSLDEGVAGGPNCISCHNLATGLSGGAPSGINFTAFNQSTHFGMNSVNSSANGACWACHDTVGNVTSGHGDKQKTPKSCEDCHLISGTYYTQAQAWGGLRVDEHYYSGTRIKAGNSSSNLTSCINCHENISEMILYNNDTDTGSFTGDGIRLNGGNKSSYHYGKNRTDLRSWNGSNTANCTYCHNNSNTLFNITMTNASVNTSLRNHSTAGSSPTCYNSSCHSGGWLHNSTLTRPLLPLPNTTYCQTCHSEKNEHNGTQQCSKCHINTTSSDTIHPIKYIQATGQYNTSNTTAANCTNCHQSLLSLNFSTAPLIPGSLKHSSNASNGSIWNSTITPYWTTEETSCYYCHNDTKHNSTALGRITVLLNTSNVRNGSLTTTGWCADCHYNATVNTNYKGNLWNPVPPVITVNNTGKARWDNHSGYFGSGYNDSVCEGCHSQNITAAGTSLNYSHSLDEGVAGGPNCIQCHNLATGLSGGAPSGINFTAFNQSTHFGMNSVNSSANGACWACHDTDGNVTSGHGDKQKTPKSCEDCHLISGTYYTQAQAWGGLRVDEHYYSGTRIKAGNSSSNLTSCINCHENISEMILYNNDTDTGSFTGDGIRLNGGNLSSYHYGKNRTDLRSWNGSNTANCTYCHNNSNTLFNITMTNASVNTSLRNHSTAGSSPTCYNSSCHSGGWLHNSTLTRPLLPLPNTTYCQTCHSEKNEHNGTQQCSKCHINTTSSDTIHPIKYIQATGQYNTSNTTAANCTNCHQSLLSGFSTAPLIPGSLKHSSNASNGSIWNSTITPYWTTEETSCYYCHNDTKHNSTALGRITVLLNTSNVRNGSLTTTGWCADCHYNATVNTNYKGNLWNPVPPVITVNNTGKARWDNHSGYFGSGYNDSVCEGCHSQNITAAGTSLNYSHSLNEGALGGPDCVSSGCHGTAGSNTSPYMNWTSLKTGMHAGLNSGAANTTSLTDPIDKACWACHGDGTQPSGHPSNYKQPYNCTACHLASGIITGKYQAKNVTEHQHVDAQLLTNSTYARCENCHNNSLVSYSDNETSPTTILTNYITANVSHYGANKTTGKLMYNTTGNSEDCVYCHLNNSNRQKWANATNASATKPDIHGSFNVSTSSSKCWECHVDSGVSGVTSGFTLHNSSLNPGASEFCLTCHVAGGSASHLNVTGTRMGAHINLNNTPVNTLNNSDCWTCHFGYPNGTTGTHSYDVTIENTYYCEDCHGPNKNQTVINKGVDSQSHVIPSPFQHAELDCGGCHVANDSRKPGGVRISIYHNSSAKMDAVGVVSNPGWTMINGVYTGCTDCHRVQNSRNGPFHAPGSVHYTSTESTCGINNCHAPEESLNNPHYQIYLPCEALPCNIYGSSSSPPTVSNLNLSPPVVNQSDTAILTAKAWDNYNPIENAKYSIINGTGVVVDWTQMVPVDGRWGPNTRGENLQAEIDTTSLSPGVYTVQVKAMAGGPKTQPGRYYPDNGEWSTVKTVSLTVGEGII